MQPAPLVEVVTGGAADGVVLTRPANGRHELSDDEAVLGFLDVLAIHPPAEVVGAAEVLVRAVKQGDVVFQKSVGVLVFDVGKHFLVISVEAIDVVFERAVIKDGRLGRGRRNHGIQGHAEEGRKKSFHCRS